MTGRWAFRKAFGGAGQAVLPVIHVLDAEQACRNAGIAIAAGAAGVFLINHDFSVERFLPIVREHRLAFSSWAVPRQNS